MSHEFCRELLKEARREALEAGIEVPKRMTAIRADRRQSFVEMDGRSGEYVSADCAYEAKAKFISRLIPEERRGVAAVQTHERVSGLKPKCDFPNHVAFGSRECSEGELEDKP